MAKQSYLNQMQWGFVLSEAWGNNEFRQRLERDPTGTIKTYARDRLGVELEHVFQMPSPPADLGMEALRSAGRSESHANGVPGSVCGSGTAPSAPGSVCGSGTSGSSGSNNT